MISDRRGFERRTRSVLLAVAGVVMIPMLSACAPVVGGAVVGAVVAIGALTSHCYDYLDVSVFDEDGRKTCAATVTASNGSDHFELGSCYYAPLTDGVWTLRATLPGHTDAISTVPVEHAHDCDRHVQTVELTLNTERPRQPLPPPAAARPAPPTMTEPISPAPAASAATPAASGTVIPTPTPPPSAVPAASGTPPVGVFPSSP